jgi:chemotaxis protein methyltransferase CheR
VGRSATAGPVHGAPRRVIQPRSFERVRKLIYEAAGIDLRQGKEALVSARLEKRLRETGHATFDEYLDAVAADRTGESLIALTDVLTTNYTSFLREPTHFEFLKKYILPSLALRKHFDIWCAAAATGEEAYSLAFTILEVLGSGSASRCRILATDISTRALATARAAVYPAERFEDVPEAWLSKYLLRGDGQSRGLYKVQPHVTQMVEFRRLNLVETFDPQCIFPLICCRNVMIYFDKQGQQRMVNRLVRFLEPRGHLFVGLSESLNGIEHPLRFVEPAIYQRQEIR